jgi:hypothetical protein
VTDWLDPEPAEKAHEAEIVKSGTQELQESPAGAELVELAVDRLFEESTSVVSAAMGFADIDLGATQCPEEWIERWGEKEAQKRFRIAQSAQMSHKEAPFALDMATKVAVAIARGKMDRAAPERQINIQIVSYEETNKAFRELEVVDGTDYSRKRSGRR